MAVSSHGTQLKMGDGATPTEVFATVAEVLDFSGPEMKRKMESSTSHDSGGYGDAVPTIFETTELSFDINYTGAATQKALRNVMTAGILKNWKVVIPTTPAETISFTGYVSGFTPDTPVEGLVKANITITRTGPVTWT
jgi:hypothetical protein